MSANSVVFTGGPAGAAVVDTGYGSHAAQTLALLTQALNGHQLERRKPELIKATRKKRIANGAGVQVQEVNRLLKQFEQTRKLMRQMGAMSGRMGRRGMKLPFMG